MSWNMMRSRNASRFNASHSAGFVFSHSPRFCSLFPFPLSTLSSLNIYFSVMCSCFQNHFSVEFSLPQGLWLVQLLNVSSFEIVNNERCNELQTILGKDTSIITRHSDTDGFQSFSRLGNRARDSWRDFQDVYTAFSLKYISNYLGK